MDNDFNQRVMEEVVHLKLKIFVFHYVGHFINASIQVVREVKQFHPSEIHEKPTVIVV